MRKAFVYTDGSNQRSIGGHSVSALQHHIIIHLAFKSAEMHLIGLICICSTNTGSQVVHIPPRSTIDTVIMPFLFT